MYTKKQIKDAIEKGVCFNTKHDIYKYTFIFKEFEEYCMLILKSKTKPTLLILLKLDKELKQIGCLVLTRYGDSKIIDLNIISSLISEGKRDVYVFVKSRLNNCSYYALYQCGKIYDVIDVNDPHTIDTKHIPNYYLNCKNHDNEGFIITFKRKEK